MDRTHGNTLERLKIGLDEVTRQLDDPALEPDPATDWKPLAERVARVKTLFENEVLQPLSAMLLDPQDAAMATPIRGFVAGLAGEIAAVLHVSGDGMSGIRLLERAVSLAEEGPIQAELRAATTDLGTYALLSRGRWLHRQGRFDDGDRLLGPLYKRTKDPALKAGMKAALDSPRPISSAPPLFRLNGCGVGLYGERDVASNGSYVSTYCISLLFIPVFPLTAYRVRREGGNQYSFFAREPLSGFAKGYRLFAAAAVALAFGSSMIAGWLDRPERRAQIALEEARSLEHAGEADRALTAYETLLRDYQYALSAADRAPAVQALVKLATAKVPAPAGVDDADTIARVVQRLREVPAVAHAPEAKAKIAATLEGWAGQIGEADEEHARASLRVLDLGATVAGPADAERLAERARAMRRGLAARLVADWPLEALAQYVALGDDVEALKAAQPILLGFGEGPSLWIEARSDVDGWLSRVASHDDMAAAATEVRARLDAAVAIVDDPARAQALEAGDDRALEAALRAHPGDQEVAVALSSIDRGRDQLARGVARLEALGAPGRMTASARLSLATLRAEAGDLEGADALLTSILAARLPGYQDARHAYDTAATAKREELLRRAQLGDIPRELDDQMRYADEESQAQIFVRWAAQQLDDDPALAASRAEVERLADVVPASLALGTIKLRRANDARGEAKQELLAGAERAFLAIRNEAEGDPSFHLGLGQVLHRLGKHEEGERELAGVIAQGTVEDKLAVASIYRQLGLVARAREVAQEVQGSAPSPHRESAAVLLSLMATELDEEERWLRLADQTDDFVQTNLLLVEARKLHRDGDLAGADRLFAQAATRFSTDARHNTASANNAALALQSRYSCTGDAAHLRRAAQDLEAAMRMEPDNALIAGNLAAVQDFRATIAVLDKWVHTRTLRLDQQSASRLLHAIGAGPDQERLVAALQADPAHRRSLEVARQREILAPQDSTAWSAEQESLAQADDVAGMRNLEERLRAVQGLETTTALEQRARFERGENDERIRADIDAAMRRAETVLADAEREGHPATIAAAALLLGLRLGDRATLGGGLEDATRAVELLRRASASPTLGHAQQVAWGLVLVAELRAAEANEAFRAEWQDGRRRYDADVLLYRACFGSNGDAVLPALRDQPELREAATLVRTSPGPRPRVSDWVLARVAGDAELETRSRPALTRDEVVIAARIDALLRPGHPGPVATLAMLGSVGVQ